MLGALLCVTVVACGDPAPGSGDTDPGAGSDAGTLDLARRPVVLISLDTCRADALSSQGGTHSVSPVLDAFAAESIVFEHARAQTPHTASSHMSLFTSQYASRHRVQNVQHGKDPATGRQRPLIEAVPEALPTLAEVLQAAGYRTVGLTDGGNLNRAHGFPRGFDEYTTELSGVEAQVADGLEWLDTLTAAPADGGQAPPWFLFWHTYEIHAPYVSPADYLEEWVGDDYQGPLRKVVADIAPLDFKGRFGAMRTTFWADKANYGADEAAYMRELYDAGVNYTDDHLATLFAAMRERGVFDEAIVILLSDHGEEFAEHGKWQHDQLYEEELRVPLMIRLPGGRNGGTRISTPVALIDVMPSLLQMLEVDISKVLPDKLDRMQGESLVSALLEAREPRPRPIYSEVRNDRKGGPLFDWQIAIHHNGLKFIIDEYRGRPGDTSGWRAHQLYDLAADPDERHDLVKKDENDPRIARFMELRDRYKLDIEALATLEALDSGGEISEAMMLQLCELGYLDDCGD
ncbi:MAG: sulfatase [Planctomycetota bacterium]|nr:MAG: sulfatase [Planctomycetota bacterium]